MRIHEGVFIGIGLIVVISTFFLEHLLFFRYVGGLFLIYGTFKLVFRLITGANTKKEALQMQSDYQQGQTAQQRQQMQGQMQRQAQQNTQQQNMQRQQPAQQQSTDFSRKQIFKCSCGNDIFPQNHFCSKCGIKLK